MGIVDGKVAIVTGAGRGIGRGEALLLAKEGAKVVVNDFGGTWDGSGESKTPADEVVDEIKKLGGEAVANYGSVANFNDAKGMVEQAVEEFGKLDILINNAGILRDRMIFNMTEDEFDLVLGVHLKGTFNTMRHASEYWRSEHKKGNALNRAIVNTASDAGLLGNPGQVNYGSAKAGIASMTLIVAEEMKKYKVRCNCIAPGARTRLTVEGTRGPAADMMKRKPKEGTFDSMDPENVAPMVVFLASDSATKLNGEVFRVGGSSVSVLRGWHTVNTIKKGDRWDPSELAEKVTEELMKGIPKKESIMSVMSTLM